ncbi:MAG: sigma-70 family RNA polymerase sigma factor [Deltaproteobacteria bacterium]|nr:sigma-70 family RNA polymerase sigma factor [Deltaproteobacteria bacterium]
MPSSASISELVLGARRGEAHAFAELARRHLKAAYAVALSVLGAPADAEDVAQEALVVAFEKLESCREPERFAGWLMQIVRNRARNQLVTRKLKGAQDVPEGIEAWAPADTDRSVLRAELLAALNTLPPLQREVVLLHDLDGWTHAEIASALGTSEVMSRQHLFVARQALRGKLKETDAVVEATHE